MYYFSYPYYPFPVQHFYNFTTVVSKPAGHPEAEVNSTESVKIVSQFTKPAEKIEEAKEQILKIVLTRQDLSKAGYDNKKKIWTEEQDKLLIFLKQKKKLDWVQISRKIPERNKKMCYSRYRRLKSTTKALWLKKDDDKLSQLVLEHGEQWNEIAKHFKNRNSRQIKEHYNNYLRPGIIECDWTLEDDLKLVDLLNFYGKNWKEIEERFDGRNINHIKNRYYGRIKKLNERKISNEEICQQSQSYS